MYHEALLNHGPHANFANLCDKLSKAESILDQFDSRQFQVIPIPFSGVYTVSKAVNTVLQLYYTRSSGTGYPD